MTPRQNRDAGFTLTEVIVAIGLFTLLTTIALTGAIAVTRSANATTKYTELTEQARITFERLTRELRQAEQITAVTLPAGPTDKTLLTFAVDFNANGVIEPGAMDPEVLTYTYDPVAKQVTLTATDTYGNTLTRPLLADKVTTFELGFRSSLWQYDKNGDGATTWQELDASPSVGNGNGILDNPELGKVDSVQITLSITDGSQQQTFQTQVGLRNNALN